MGGPNPVRVSYHVFDSGGSVVVWDGRRSSLPKDVGPGETVTVDAVGVAPSANAQYTVRWDLVQEGVAWFSTYGLATKSDPLQVFPGVTIYGKGWGHGVGMSQWGAQGWATGAGGPPLTGEQIVQRYFPGSTFGPVPAKPLHVLLSSPSTGCLGRTIYDVAQVRSDGGVRVVKWNDPSQVLLNAVGGQTVRVFMNGNTLQVMDEWSARIIYSGTDTIGVLPNDPTRPITVDQKLRYYRGSLGFEPIGFNALRVINEVDLDDYARGSVPSEMLTGWHVEAYKSQSYAAKSYAAWRQSSSNKFWDVRDDTADQCYGGASVETAIVTQAVEATRGRILMYGNTPVKAYYSSANGGSSDSPGCVWNLVKIAGRYSCGSGEPYLVPVPDPAELAAVGPSGPNPHRSWTVTIPSWQIENAVARNGYNIGSFISLDLSNAAPGGHVISVRITGTYGTVELPADSFLRTSLRLRSTMAKTFPF
jgi:SpoIID/LytB domain protein